MEPRIPHLRIARPVTELARTLDMYARGLELRVLDRFQDHDGFDGVMLGVAGAPYHFEFTSRRGHPMRTPPSPEDLLVFYVPDPREWELTCARMLAAGFRPVAPVNPYWALRGRSYEDPDGYRLVIERSDGTVELGPGFVTLSEAALAGVPRY